MRVTFMELYSLSQGGRSPAASRVPQRARLRDIDVERFTAPRWMQSCLPYMFSRQDLMMVLLSTRRKGSIHRLSRWRLMRDPACLSARAPRFDSATAGPSATTGTPTPAYSLCV